MHNLLKAYEIRLHFIYKKYSLVDYGFMELLILESFAESMSIAWKFNGVHVHVMKRL